MALTAQIPPIPLGPRRTIPVAAPASAMATVLGANRATCTAADVALQLTETAERITLLTS